MIFKMKGHAIVDVWYDGECESCGHIVEKEEQRTVLIEEEVKALDSQEAQKRLVPGQRVTGHDVIIEEGERVYFEGWDDEPEIRPLGMDVILRRRGEPELF